MDGAPIFSLFQETLRGAHVLSFEGVLNSTSNFILSEMEAGRSYAVGVAGAKERGLLEADPAMDLEGWDATVKACLLANVLMGGRLRPEDVPRQGIAGIDADRVRRARAAGGGVKQGARGGRGPRRPAGGPLRARRRPPPPPPPPRRPSPPPPRRHRAP